jgi:hypothetical protein
LKMYFLASFDLIPVSASCSSGVWLKNKQTKEPHQAVHINHPMKETTRSCSCGFQLGNIFWSVHKHPTRHQNIVTTYKWQVSRRCCLACTVFPFLPHSILQAKWFRGKWKRQVPATGQFLALHQQG